MIDFNRHKGWMSGVLIAVMTLATIAPIAEAGGHGNKNGRHRGNSDSGYRGDSDRRGDSGYRGDSGRRGDGGYRGNDGYRDRHEYRQVYQPRQYRDRGYSGYRSNRGYGGYSTYRVSRRGNAGPVIAGFIGGLFLGATLANAAPAGYEYYDPYCHRSYGSLASYNAHLCGQHQHGNVVRVRERVSTYERRYDRSYERDEVSNPDDGYDDEDWQN